MADITKYEKSQIDEANKSGLTPIVFVHGLWLLPSSWDRWRTVFEEAGFTTLAPGWPDDPNTVEEANAHPEVFAHKTVGQIADHFGDVIGKLAKKPAVIGHSFGGLLTQILAGRGLSAASVAIDPAPFRGVLPLPISALKSSKPVLGNPANHGRAVRSPTSSSATRSPTRSPRPRPTSSTTRTRSRDRESRCSRPRPRTSTRGPKRR